MARHHPIFPRIRFAGGSGPGPDPDPDPGEFARAASTNATMSIHSGHSLTDAYVHMGPWPGSIRAIAESVGVTDAADKIIGSTIPGSPLSWRWDNPKEDVRPGNPSADARLHIADFDTLMITEGGPPPRTTQATMTDTLDYLCRFVANTIENGAGNEVILWSIWPALNGPGTSPENQNPTGVWEGFTFRTGLDEYYKSFKFMADYATWKMKQLYPSLPSDWRVWLFPGDRWMARVYDDIQNGLVPGVTDIADLFDDDIHPTPLGGYGLSCLVASCTYQVNLTDAADVWIMPAHTDATSNEWPAVPQELAEYFWQIAWDIATEYEPVGMGGTEGGSLEWQPSDGDLMPEWTFDDPNTGGGGDPDPEPGELPEFVFTASAADTADLLAMTGTQPTVEDGVLKFVGGEVLDADLALTDRYVVMSIMVPDAFPTNTFVHILGFRATDTQGWDGLGPVFLSYNGYTNRYAVNSGGTETGIETRPELAVWETVEFWTDGTNVYGAINGTEYSIAATTPETVVMRLFSEGAIDAHVAAIGVCDYVPDADGRAAARAWAQSAIPE